VENAAQRIHEDTQRFARGLQTCCVVLLDSVLTIVVFAPILVNLGSEVQPSKMPGSWMLLMCAGVAFAGVLVSVVLGWSLVALEVENQKAEADLRKQLVLEEERVQPATDTRRTDTTHPSTEYVDADTLDALDAATFQRTRRLDLNQVFQSVVLAIIFNYRRLYYKFAVFSLWLGAYEQFVVILPYVITGPLLFATDHRITLGKVTQVSHAFGNVFDALNILSDRWIDVTDWVSVMRRLREFEASVGCRTTTRSSLIPATELASSSTLHVNRC
jgi:peptide/bleomycin uptake transporter